MKRKLLALAAAAALGVSVFGVNAQAMTAQEASVYGCSHSTLVLVSKEIDHYDQASGDFHRTYYELTYECANEWCKYKVTDLTYEIEDHIFSSISENGRWCCGLCGEEGDQP